ncbi:MAG: cell division protein ZapA [Oscillospiraceae bacterium]|nr:cell division protein ZapA [Oscillospiraceae bacterium]
MERVKLKICNRDYSLVTDGDSTRLEAIAESLEKQIVEYSKNLNKRSESEVLTLVALNILEESDKEITACKNELKGMELKLSEHDKKLNFELAENIHSANSEMEQIANFKDSEKAEMQRKLLEYENTLEKLVEEKQSEIALLNKGFVSAQGEMEHIATIKEEENIKLRNTLNSFERTFDEYTKVKEAEIVKLREELDESRAECDELRQRLAALDDEGQISLC